MSRKPQETGRRAALDQELKAMFRALERRPIPEGLVGVVDQLAEPSPARRRARG